MTLDDMLKAVFGVGLTGIAAWVAQMRGGVTKNREDVLVLTQRVEMLEKSQITMEDIHEALDKHAKQTDKMLGLTIRAAVSDEIEQKVVKRLEALGDRLERVERVGCARNCASKQ